MNKEIRGKTQTDINISDINIFFEADGQTKNKPLIWKTFKFKSTYQGGKGDADKKTRRSNSWKRNIKFPSTRNKIQIRHKNI